MRWLPKLKRLHRLDLLANVILALLIGGSIPVSVEADTRSTDGSGWKPFVSEQQEPPTLELVGRIGGPTYGVAVQGNYAYVGIGNSLYILNVSSPARPSVVAQTPPLPDQIRRVAASGTYVYVADGEKGGLRIVDASDLSHPTEAGYYDTPGIALDVVVRDRYAYVADYSAGLRIIDVSNPQKPVEVASFGSPGMASGAALARNYAYVADMAIGLRIVDISDPVSPRQVGSFKTKRLANDVAVVGNYAYVAEAWSAVRVIDVSDPANPQEVGFYGTMGPANDLVAAGDYVYVADGGKGLRVLDVANPARITHLGIYGTRGSTSGVTVVGDYAYVADGSGGLRIVSIADKNRLIEAGFYGNVPNYPDNVYIAGKYAYVTSKFGHDLHIVDVSNPQAPIQVGFYDTKDSTGGLVVVGRYAYIALGGSGGMRILDVSDPVHPTEVGTFAANADASHTLCGCGPPSVAVAGNYAYLAHNAKGLSIISIADPRHPVEVGSFQTGEAALDVKVSGNYAYVADGEGLRIIDVSNPAKPNQVGFYDTPDRAKGVEVKDRYAYVADSSGGLRIIDVSNPVKPSEVGFYQTRGDAVDVAVADRYAFVANSYTGISVIDISNPLKPRQVTSYRNRTYSTVEAIVADGEYVYAVDPGDALLVLKLVEPTGGPGEKPAGDDWDIPNGHFFTQARGDYPPGFGYAVLDDAVAPLWSEFRRLGGVDALGYPISRRFTWDGFASQAFQKAVFQWRPEVGRVYFVNIFDLFHGRSYDGLLQQYKSIPPYVQYNDTGLTWDQIVESRRRLLDPYPEIRSAYFSVGDWLNLNGLPSAPVADYGNVRVLRAQRVIIQQWLVDVPWAAAGQVVFANGGDIAKELRLFPESDREPESWSAYEPTR